MYYLVCEIPEGSFYCIYAYLLARLKFFVFRILGVTNIENFTTNVFAFLPHCSHIFYAFTGVKLSVQEIFLAII